MKIRMTCLLLIVMLFSVIPAFADEDNETLEMTFIDQIPFIYDRDDWIFCHGDCTYIEFPNGENMLIDASSAPVGKGIIDWLMARGVNSIDYFVASHVHQDHVGGFRLLADAFEIGQMICSGHGKNNLDQDSMFWITVQREKLPVLEVRAGDILTFGEVTIKVLWPAEDAPDPSYGDSDRSAQGEALNPYSLVFQIQYGEFSALFTGDIHVESEKEMIQLYGDELQSTLIKIAHHGLTTSTSQEFVDKVQPKMAVCMATGAERAIQRTFSRRRIPFWGTWDDGNVTVKTDGKTVEVHCFKGTTEIVP